MNRPLNARTFVLIANEDGQASESTIMRFSLTTEPLTAEYSGPNLVHGQALVAGDQMLYHALQTDGTLNAGHATIELVEHTDGAQMHLHWRWLTGDQSSGVSIWQEAVEAPA